MLSYNYGALHMIPLDQDGSVTKMKLASVHMATLSPLSEMKNLSRFSLFKQPQINFDFTLTIK